MQILCIDSTLAFHEFGRQTVFDHECVSIFRCLRGDEVNSELARHLSQMVIIPPAL
jgi:hypothetical protein